MEFENSGNLVMRQLNHIDPDCNYYNTLQTHSTKSNYYTIDQFNDLTNVRVKSVFVLCYNIRSFHTNGDSFLSFLQSLKNSPDIIVLCETWLTTENKNLCNINGYISPQYEGS